jgi:hypothetical protein
MSGYSVFIPRMFSNIGESRIRRIFHEHNIGNVERVDLVSKTSGNGDTYNMAFVHFDSMYDTESSANFRQDVENSDSKTKLVYDEPWFWLVLPFVQKEKKSIAVNPIARDFVPQEQEPYNNHMPMTYANMEEQQWANAGLVPMWSMTPQGPIIQWGYPQYMPYDIRPVITTNNSKTNMLKKALKMVPRQVAYGKHYDVQRKHQRKRLNLSTIESRKETYAKENGAIIDNSIVFGVGIDKILEAELEKQNDYHNQVDMYQAMDKIANKKQVKEEEEEI